MYATRRKMQQSFSCPNEIKRNPFPNPSEMPKYSDDFKPNCPSVPTNTLPDKNNTQHGMTLRRTPNLSPSHRYMQPNAHITGLDVSPKSRPGQSRRRSGSTNHAGHPSQTTLKGAANSDDGDSLLGTCRKPKKPYDRKQKTTDPVSSSLRAPELDVDYSSISGSLTERLLESMPKPTKTRGQKRNYTQDSSNNDPLAFSVSPLRLKPEDAQSSTPFNTEVVSKHRIDSQTTSEPRKARNGNKHESPPTSRKANAPLDQHSQHESQLSSDLSIEFSFPEEELVNLNLSLEEDDEEDEVDEEFPSFLLQISKKPACIKDGNFVWCKYRSFPFWPAVVKHVNPKMKKASIVWIDMPTFDKKRKGWYVPLRTLKPFECEEAKQLVCAAKENYAAVIDWSLELINDYIFRIACGSFTGSFIEYWMHIMSSPVRSKYPQEFEGLALPSRLEFDERQSGVAEDSAAETPEGGRQGSKRLLPDRTMAAHNRANEKLVHFIVSQRMVDQHLLAVIRGQQPSKWLNSFLRATRRLQVRNYLEDDKQLDQVYNYLKGLFDNVTDRAPCLANVKFMDDVRFAMDVLLPEAIISAIAGVDNISLEKAEKKYLNGRCISDREREEFELTIEQQIKKK